MEDAMAMAKQIADSGCFGITKPAQAITLMMMAREEGKTLAQLLKEVHVFDTGKLSQRADYTQSVFQQHGTILWHLRTNTVVAGSFFTIKPITDEDRKRACERFGLQYELDIMQMQPEWDRKRESELMLALSKLARENECTVIRTLADAEAKGITQGKSGTKNNWAAGAISMLQWRCVTDAVKLIDPSVMSGLSSDVDLQDARVVEQRLAIEQKSPQEREKDAIKSMMAQHLEDAEQATGERRKELLGLASDLRCKLAEMDITSRISSDLPMKAAEVPDTHNAGMKTVDATDATVEPPDQLPGLAEPAPEPRLTKWQDYEVTKYGNKRLGSLSKEEVSVLHAAYQKKDLGKAKPDIRKEASMIAMAFEALNTPKK
jgi:hypothetical protein